MEIRPFKPLVARRPERTHEDPSDKILTPANVITAIRPGIGAIAVKMLVNGEQGAWKPTGAALITDALDGFVARWFDKHMPHLRIGTSKLGSTGDQWFDVVTALEIASVIPSAPRRTFGGARSAELILAQESYKTGWAATRAAEYYHATGQLLEVPTSDLGREAMIEKGCGLFLAVLSSDFDDPIRRLQVGSAALGMSTLGTIHGEQARQQYDVVIDELLAAA